MTEPTDTQTTTKEEHTDIEAIKKKNTRFNHVWWLPLIALLVVTYVAVNRYTSKGPLITITFSSAEGLAVGKTKVRYKDVEVGKVERIDLNDHYGGVTVFVRINKANESMLRKNTRFWVVKPRVSITQISGLNTLLSGNYISIEPDKNSDSDYRYQFDGLETPPIITQDEPGLKLTVLTNKASSLYPGTTVYYKGMPIGRVNRVYFSDDYLWVKADIFIAAPHDKLIHPMTKFWSTSGFSIDASADGINVEMESVESLFAGGITFETPVSSQIDDAKTIENGTEFFLYANKKQAFEQSSGRKQHYVTYFDASVKGLEIGSSVTMQGINIGKVKDIQLLFDAKKNQTRTPVLFEIYESRLRLVNENNITPLSIQQVSEKLIRNGLKAQLETANLLTGAKQIALVMTKQSGAKDQPLLVDKITGYPILPSTAQSFDAITASVSNLANKVNQMPLDEIANNLNRLLKNADKTISSLTIDETLKRVDSLLENTTGLSNHATKSLKTLDRSLVKLTKRVEKTLSGFSPDAPLYYNLNKTLKKLNDTLHSLKSIVDTLDRKPNALIFGD
ncbi:MAG: hypothetical protein CSA45_02505 [Gammaproteobacteria bacterium]|nr:MAG: hypothetical protein CSA45_02505 [Gammaproteobacteria bacterium]